MRWRNKNGGCLPAVLAGMLDVHPADIPGISDQGELDWPVLNAWLADRDVTLQPVRARAGASWGEVYPDGDWIALLDRGPNLAHAVHARRSTVIHDPGATDARESWLSPGDFDRIRTDWNQPLGYTLEPINDPACI